MHIDTPLTPEATSVMKFWIKLFETNSYCNIIGQFSLISCLTNMGPPFSINYLRVFKNSDHSIAYYLTIWLTLGEFCFTMIGRADIKESKCNIAMNAWLP